MNAIAKVGYSHDAMIDLLIANPMITQRELANNFHYTEGWVSRIIRSDAFRERLASRKSEVSDPLVLQSVEQRFEALVARALEVLEGKMDAEPTALLALKTAELASKALGYGAKTPAVNIQNFVVAMPEKARDATDWLAGRRVIEGTHD